LQFFKRMSWRRPDTAGLGEDSAVEGEPMLRNMPQGNIQLRQLLELMAFGQKLGSQSRAWNDASEIAVRNFSPRHPLPATTLKRSEIEPQRLTPHVERSQQRSRSLEGSLDIPVLAPQVKNRLIAILRLVSKRR